MGRPAHVLLDFFGTLVRHGDGLPDYPRSHELVRGWGCDLSYLDFMAAYTEVAGRFEKRAEAAGREYTMAQFGRAVLRRALPRQYGPAEVESFVDCVTTEWLATLSHLDGLAEVLARLARDHRLAVVSNTMDTVVVPALVSALGIGAYLDAVVLSSEVGWRKPHPEIYRVALRRLGAEPESTVFVGDSYLADYVGPRRLGLRALLVDPTGSFDVPADERLASVLELPSRLENL
jgi:putative hydrolase of the HAD superfamily